MGDALKKCSGCGCVTNGKCDVDVAGFTCGQPLCDDCTHVDKSYSWTHEPKGSNNSKEMKMSDPIKVLEIEEHEDGSATVKLECDPKTFGAIFNVGFVSLVKTGLYWETNDETKTESTND